MSQAVGHLLIMHKHTNLSKLKFMSYPSPVRVHQWVLGDDVPAPYLLSKSFVVTGAAQSTNTSLRDSLYNSGIIIPKHAMRFLLGQLRTCC